MKFMDTYETPELSWGDLQKAVRRPCVDTQTWKERLLKRLASHKHYHGIYGGFPTWGGAESQRIIQALKLLGMSDSVIHEELRGL